MIDPSKLRAAVAQPDSSVQVVVPQVEQPQVEQPKAAPPVSTDEQPIKKNRLSYLSEQYPVIRY